MSVADYIIIGIIVVFALVGLKTGLLRSLYKVASYVLSIFLAIKLSKPVAGWFRGTGIFEGIRKAVDKLTLNLNINFGEVADPTNVEGIKEAISDTPFPESIKDIIANAMSSGAESATSMIDDFVDKVAFFILVIICAVAIFIVLRILFWLAGFLIKGISEIPILKQVDRLAGFILGASVGVALVYVVCLVLTYTAAYEGMGFIYENISEGVIAPFFYDKNILPQFFKFGDGGWL